MLFLGHHPPYLWGRSATDLKLKSRPCSLTIRAPEIHLFPPPQPWGYKHEPPCLAFGKRWFWELNSGDYASKVSTLPPAELPPYPVRNWKQSPPLSDIKSWKSFQSSVIVHGLSQWASHKKPTQWHRRSGQAHSWHTVHSGWLAFSLITCQVGERGGELASLWWWYWFYSKVSKSPFHLTVVSMDNLALTGHFLLKYGAVCDQEQE